MNDQNRNANVGRRVLQVGQPETEAASRPSRPGKDHYYTVVDEHGGFDCWFYKLEDAKDHANEIAGHVLDLVDFRTYSAEKKVDRSSELDAVCARDAADIVRPPGHPLGQLGAERRECWEVRMAATGESISRYTLECSADSVVTPNRTKHHMVELRDGERIVTPRVMAERDAAIRERDDARRDVVRSVISSLADDACRRIEANERWPGSGEVLFPPEIGES